MTLHTGDCLDVMRTLPDASVDAVCTDPPYGLEFMGKGWDKFGATVEAQTDVKAWPNGSGVMVEGANGPFGGGGSRVRYAAGHSYQQWCEAWGREALRVTVPGGYLLAFGGTRTHHRLVCGLEDAGWLIRDELDWIYASGFPKGKANLKPAHEPIVLARKPGPLRMLGIDACRIGTDSVKLNSYAPHGREGATAYGGSHAGETYDSRESAGRWPANVILTDPVFDGGVDGVVGGGDAPGGISYRENGSSGGMWGQIGEFPAGTPNAGYGDSGTYSRFFLIPKADRGDREPPLRVDTEPYEHSGPRGHSLNGDGTPRASSRPRANGHPTVKPIELMRHLVRLVTPPRVSVLYCPRCDTSTDVPPVRANVRANAETTVLLDEVSSDSRSDSGENVSGLPDEVLEEGSDVGEDVLLPEVRQPSTSASAEAVRAMPDAIPAGHQGGAVLFEDLRSTMGGSEEVELPGLDDKPGGLHLGVESDAPERPQVGVRDAAPPRHGRRAESSATPDRSGRPPQRDQGRQPTGEPAGSVEARARQPQEATAQADHLPSLPVDDLSLGPCPTCGGSRTAPERRGLVLDPFGGSGTTAIAAELEGFDWILIEKEAEYVAIAEARLNGVQKGLGLV